MKANLLPDTPVLYLDHSGPLHPAAVYRSTKRGIHLRGYGAFIKDYFECLPRVEEVLLDFPEVKIVISSDWRKLHTLDELRACVSEDLRERAIGMTPRFSFDEYGEGIRFDEAQAYLSENNLDFERWVAPDDITENWVNPNMMDFDPRLMRCADGFWDEADALLTQALLQRVERR